MPVKVNNYLIEPAPKVEINKELIVAGNQTKLGSTYRLSIQGDLVAWMGSPQGGSLAGTNWGGYNNQFWMSSAPAPSENIAQFHKLYSIESKQRALEWLFSQNGSTIEWQSPDGSQPLKAQFKNASVQFPAGDWAQTCPYVINAECDILYLLNQPIQDASYVGFSGLIQQAGESWDIQLTDVVKTFTVTHQVNAVGKIVFDTFGNITQSAWMNARDFVLTQLTLGISGTSQFSNIAGGTLFAGSTLASGILDLNQYTAYNASRTESIDELAGSVSITETFWLAPTSSGTHVYNVSTRRIVEEPYVNVVSNIQGTIRGYYDGLFNYDQRISGAQYEFFGKLGGPTGLWYLVSAAETGYSFNIQPRQGSIDYNFNEGTLSYNFEFSNQLYQGETLETWQASRKTSSDNYITTYSMNGTIRGRRYVSDTGVFDPFYRAYTYWITLSGANFYPLFERMLSSKYYPEASGLGVQPGPVSRGWDLNEAEGIITYSLEWNNRQVDSGNWSNLVTEEYQISQSFSREEGVTHYNINGTIMGLNVVDTSDPQKSKFDNASGYYYSYVANNLYNRVANYFNITLPFQQPISIEVGLFPKLGQVTYQNQFSNIFPPIMAGVLSEHITVNEVNYNQQINSTAKIGVPGRSSGPVIQDLGTTVIKSRTINIETVLPPTGSLTDLSTAFANKPNYDSYILQLKPINSYCENWSDQYDWRYGRYSITAEFIYE